MHVSVLVCLCLIIIHQVQFSPEPWFVTGTKYSEETFLLDQVKLTHSSSSIALSIFLLSLFAEISFLLSLSLNFLVSLTTAL